MARYRVTFRDTGGHLLASRDFDAKGDSDAPLAARQRIPLRTAGYEIWRDDDSQGSQRSELIFAEWTLVDRPATK